MRCKTLTAAAAVLLMLMRMDEANGRFHKLTSYGEKHLFDKIKMDYFALVTRMLG